MAQEDVRIELGKKNLLLEENFTLKVIIRNTDKSAMNAFPELPNFTKGARQKVFSKNPLGYTITQNYTPTKEGNFKIPSFILTINNKDYLNESFNIVVNSPKDDSEAENETILPEKAKNNAFLAINVSKNKVYIGEGFKVSLAFYVSESNTIKMDFADDLNAQVDAISKKIKSPDCLEQRISISDLIGTATVINGKKYLSYKFFEAIYFPLNNKPINIPAVELRMVQTNKNAKESVTFKDTPQKILVLDLPEHPLKDKVSAGNFNLVEQIETRKINTGKSFSYSFKIVGDGNFATVNVTSPINDSFFDFYPPEIKENRPNGQPSQEKLFRYRILPKDSGQYQFDKYFFWVFFNTKKEQYDTLKSALKIKVLGKTIANKDTDTSDDIFAGIDKLDTSRTETNYQEVLKNISNLLIICMLTGSLYLFNWRRKKKANNE
ncbi:MAG: BatD family protein [Emticicia sp.]